MMLEVSPIQWSKLKNIDDVDPLNNADTECLLEIRDVLQKHGKLNRFGVALLHSHFDLAADEAMVETCDLENRTLTLKAVKQSEVGPRDVGTIWKLGEGDFIAMSWCRSYCKPHFWDGHQRRHKKEK
ncbi:MAG TPA: hypothetical protein VGD94_03715 [Vicinamibacterales bacterium]